MTPSKGSATPRDEMAKVQHQIILAAADIMRSLLADQADAAARKRAEQYIREVREMQAEQASAIFKAGQTTPEFFGGRHP